MKQLKLIGAGILCFFMATYFLSGTTTLDPGEVGIVVQNLGTNRGMQDYTLDTGWHWIEPFSYDTIVYDTRLKQYDLKGIPAGTQDGQPITVDVSFEIGLRDSGVPSLHETVGKDYFDEVVYPAARSAIRTATANKLSDEVYTGAGRVSIQDELSNYLQVRLEPVGIRISANLRDIEFQNKDFVATLERKAKAAQEEVIQQRLAAAAKEEAIKVQNRAEGERFKREQAAAAQKYELQAQGEGERLKQEEIAKGILAVGQAEADVIKLKATALVGSGGTLYRDIEVLGGLGQRVEFYGVPTGAENTNTYIIDEALRGKIAIGGNSQ